MKTGEMVDVLVRNREGFHVSKPMHWGLVPDSYAAFPEVWTGHTSHARIETVHELPAFSKSWQRKWRVIFPMNHFQQRTHDARTVPGFNRKQVTVNISRSDAQPMGVAGIFNAFNTPEGLYLSCAMLTRPASSGLEGINDRFPAMIDPHDFIRWLDGADDLDLETPPAADVFAIRIAA
jgi:putative SOS response-associated peptidase YedK